LAALPASIGNLQLLADLNLTNCCFTTLPESFAQLTALKQLSLRWCEQLASLSEPLWQRLAALEQLDLSMCAGLPQPTPKPTWSPQKQVQHMLKLQLRQLAIAKLVNQQETMLATLERMSWLAVLLATATFIAYMQPPGGLKDYQVLVSNDTACASGSVIGSKNTCALLAFFILDGLSFGISVGCVMMIIVLSMPRLQSSNEQFEAGRFWLLLLATWVLLYLAVLTGFGAFIASGLTVFNVWGIVLVPLVPGMVLLLVGIAVIGKRFHDLNPGWPALLAAISVGSWNLRPVVGDPDVELGQTMFWKHCKTLLSTEPKQPTAWPVTVVGSPPDEWAQLLDRGSGSSGDH
jgi:uncharacterized membrane protein YhaH (DUF805 family)